MTVFVLMSVYFHENPFRHLLTPIYPKCLFWNNLKFFRIARLKFLHSTKTINNLLKHDSEEKAKTASTRKTKAASPAGWVVVGAPMDKRRGVGALATTTTRRRGTAKKGGTYLQHV